MGFSNNKKLPEEEVQPWNSPEDDSDEPFIEDKKEDEE